MGIDTKIEWCDSTLNLQMGCDGCELWNNQVRTCYAGILTERYKGQNSGFPKTFAEPELYLKRLEQLQKWPDQTGTPRLHKPWLDGLPRFVFLNDMGDTFTESLEHYDWLARTDLYDDDLGRRLHWQSPLQIMADTPHFYLLLTKRPSRLARMTEMHGPLPDNVMAMTSVTSMANIRRVEWLMKTHCKWRGLSIEPMLGPVDLNHLSVELPSGGIVGGSILGNTDGRMFSPRGASGRGINWVISGNESGRDRRDWEIEWPIDVTRQCVNANVPAFTKQVIVKDGRKLPYDEFPKELQLRQMPRISEKVCP